jgi:ubiquinone/menaquinone biosynthesis C-methylase UbiE
MQALESSILELGFLPGDYVADFGSGSGHLSLALARLLGEKGRVYAVDIHADGLVRLENMAKENSLENIYILCGDVEKPNGTLLKRESVRGVLLSNILFLLEDKLAAIEEAKRILIPEGRLVLIENSERVVDVEFRKNFERNNLVLERQFKFMPNSSAFIFRKG